MDIASTMDQPAGAAAPAPDHQRHLRRQVRGLAVGGVALVLAATLGFRVRELRRQAARLASLPRGPDPWA